MNNAAGIDKENPCDKARRYSAAKYSLAVIEIIFVLVFLFVFQGLGISKILAKAVSNFIPNHYFTVAIYISALCIIYYLLGFPLNLYRSFLLEHRFSLSNQTIGNWLKDQIKAVFISYLIIIILAEVFYYILEHFHANWWLIVSLLWIFFSVILAKLTPVVIIPLFFKYKRFSDDELRKRIINLADKMGIKILDVFEINFSKKTAKANAAFVGIGNTKRVILADTLKGNYSYDEIQVILAHEFAHYRLRHLLKLILVSSLVTICSFYLIFKTSGHFLSILSFSSLSDIAALPIILIYFVICGLIAQPLENYISRRLEINADIMALKVTDLKEAFISMMEKLSLQNLADRNPHPIIKFFFFDHPSINERIAMAKS